MSQNFYPFLIASMFLHIVSVEEIHVNQFKVTLEIQFYFTFPPAKQVYLSYSITAHSLLYINCSFAVPIRLCWNSKWIWYIHLNDSANHRLPSCLIREPQSHLITIILPYFLDQHGQYCQYLNTEKNEKEKYTSDIIMKRVFINSGTNDDVVRLDREWNIGSEVLYLLQDQCWFWHLSHSSELQKKPKQVLAI